MSFTMKTLTEGIRQRHMGAQHQRLTEKWNRTGLLRGLNGYNRENMAVMLENQAAQLLRETNTLGSAAGPGQSGDIRGFPVTIHKCNLSRTKAQKASSLAG